jgi:hypothetical protein
MAKLNVKSKKVSKMANSILKLSIPKGIAINISKIYNPVDAKNMKQRKPKKITDLVALAEQNSKIMNAINDLIAKGVTFSLSDFGISGYTKLKDFLFDEIAQRDLILKHIGDTLPVYTPTLTSPAFVAEVNGDKYNYDTQHGLTMFALLCKYGLIREVQSEDYLDAPYASYTIPNASAGLPAYSAMTRNGLGQKKWSSFDHHKTKAGLARQYPQDYGMMFAKELRMQEMCELYEAIPVSPQSVFNGKAGTISRVDSLYKYEEYQVEFTLERHKTYWHGTHLDDAAYGFYGNLVTYSKSVGWPKKNLIKLTDHLSAIVYDFFTDLAGARTEVVNAHERWFRACNPLAKKVPSPGDDCFLSIMEKIYLKLNGTCQVTSQAYSYVHNNKDIYDYLPDEIKNKVDTYVNDNIAW